MAKFAGVECRWGLKKNLQRSSTNVTDDRQTDRRNCDVRMGALFYSPVDFTDASDLHQCVQV